MEPDCFSQKYPEETQDFTSLQLAPEMEMANRLAAAGPAFDPRPDFLSASCRRMQIHAGLRRRRNPWRTWQWSALYWWQSPRLNVGIIVLLMAVLYLNVTCIARASVGWLPGDLLYPLKPAGEEIHLLARLTAEGDARLHIEFARRRMVEIQGLVLENRFEEIPRAVANFNTHVTQAVTLVNQLADEHRASAPGLAVMLQSTLNSQIGVVPLFSKLNPTMRSELERILFISNNGMSDVQDVLSPKSKDNGL